MKTMKTASFHMKMTSFHERPLARNGNPIFYLLDYITLTDFFQINDRNQKSMVIETKTRSMRTCAHWPRRNCSEAGRGWGSVGVDRGRGG